MDTPISYEELLDAYRDQTYLIEVGRDLMRIRDLDTLFRKILEVSRKITGADAGSIFIADTVNNTPVIRFKYSHTISKHLPYEEFVLPRTLRSIAGYVSLTGKSLSIPDVYYLSGEEPYEFNRAFDQIHGYRSKSVLAVPMINHKGTIIGVIQMINSKELDESLGKDPDTIILRDYADFEMKVTPFKERYIAIMEAIAAQAAIAFENSRMVNTIESQFENFVMAAVEAVETRDPPTSGHSFRVAQYSVSIANRINELKGIDESHPDAINLKELNYAGILHDFGKIYIDPYIFLKAKKLYPSDYSLLCLRHKYLLRNIDYDYLKKQRNSDFSQYARYEKERENIRKELTNIHSLIDQLNEPALLSKDPDELLGAIRAFPLPNSTGIDGELIPILTDEETLNLRTKRGSLNIYERAQIEKHVAYSYEFVKRIPWPPEYARIPEYILNHHEFLDGSGYPNHTTAKNIPIQSRILTVADIYDALTAADRPYKKAVSKERAILILKEEAEKEKLDKSIVGCLSTILEDTL